MKAAMVVIGTAAALAVLGFIVSSRLPQDFSVPVPSLGKKTGSSDELPKLGRMPEFAGISDWLNSAPLARADLAGKVVLVDFWTYSCINCIRTLPYVTGWHEKYKDQGFIVIGVHTPEFAFEKERDNVAEAISRYAITYPVAQDNAYATWNAYANRYWPAHYLFDHEGNLRYTHFGEGEYETTEAAIQALLRAAGQSITQGALEGPGTPVFKNIGTPETYLGYDRATLLGSPEQMQPDEYVKFSVPTAPRLNLFYLAGLWKVEAERVVAGEADAVMVYRYKASAANLVMSQPQAGAARVRVLLDGAVVPPELRGQDVFEEDGQTYVLVDDERLYNLIDAKGDYRERTLRLEFESIGTSAYAFTFG